MGVFSGYPKGQWRLTLITQIPYLKLSNGSFVVATKRGVHAVEFLLQLRRARRKAGPEVPEELAGAVVHLGELAVQVPGERVSCNEIRNPQRGCDQQRGPTCRNEASSMTNGEGYENDPSGTPTLAGSCWPKTSDLDPPCRA